MRLKLKNMRAYLQDYYGSLIYREKKRVLGLVNVGSCQVGGTLPKGRTRKTRNKETRTDLIKRKVKIDRNAWKSIKRNCSTHASMKRDIKTNLLMI